MGAMLDGSGGHYGEHDWERGTGLRSVERFSDGVGVALLVCGGAITGRHEATMIGLALIIFAGLME